MAIVRVTRKLVERITCSVPVNVLKRDIEEGACGLQYKCMHKIAVARSLEEKFKGDRVHHVRVSGESVKFNGGGYRWIAALPPRAQRTMQLFDDPETKHLVKPHSYRLVAERKSKVKNATRDRQSQINEARRARIRAGIPDKEYHHPTVRERITGQVRKAA